MQSRVQMPKMLLATTVSPHPRTHCRDQMITDRTAAVMGDQDEFADTEFVEEGAELRRDAGLPVITAAFVGLAVTLEVDGQAVIAAAEPFQRIVPLPQESGSPCRNTTVGSDAAPDSTKCHLTVSLSPGASTNRCTAVTAPRCSRSPSWCVRADVSGNPATISSADRTACAGPSSSLLITRCGGSVYAKSA